MIIPDIEIRTSQELVNVKISTENADHGTCTSQAVIQHVRPERAVVSRIVDAKVKYKNETSIFLKKYYTKYIKKHGNLQADFAKILEKLHSDYEKKHENLNSDFGKKCGQRNYRRRDYFE